MKLVVTGGHLTPALSVIDALSSRDEVVFIGRKHAFEGDAALSFEYKEITARTIPFYSLKTGRLQRSFTTQTIPSLLRFPKGIKNALMILQKEQPDCILSFGGYIGLPVVIAGRMLSIPSVIHEQTFHAGFSNKTASRFAAKICISWDKSRPYFPKHKTVLTGNPLRKEILAIKKKKKKKNNPPLIYVTGGTAGAHQVNVLLEKYVDTLLAKYSIVHQTGDTQRFDDYSRLSKIREKLPQEKKERYQLYTFTNSQQAAEYLYNADLVISRSGINTVTELLYLEKKSYLVPLLHGQKGEQMTNAQFLKNIGLSQMYTESDDFVSVIDTMIASHAYTVKNPVDVDRIEHASENIVSVLYDVIQKKNKNQV